MPKTQNTTLVVCTHTTGGGGVIFISSRLKTAAAWRLYLLLAVLLAMTGCEFIDPFYVQVAFIQGVPETGTAGTPLFLTGIVRPVFASNKNIFWFIKDAGTTGASINGNILYAAAEGTITIRAVIINGIAQGKEYTQDFIIVISGGPAVTEPITHVAITVTFAQITDDTPNIDGPTLSRSGTNHPKTAAFQIDGSGYDSIGWEITGTGFSGQGIGGTGYSFTLDAADVRYNRDGDHHLTLTVYKDGIPYNKIIIFRIVQ